MRESCRVRSGGLLAALVLLAVAMPTGAFAAAGEPGGLEKAGDWFSENFEVHGWLRTRFHVRVPEFSNNPTPSSLRNEINLEPELRLFSGDDLELSFYGVVRGVYEAVYDYRGDVYGSSPDNGAFGTGGAYPGNVNAFYSANGRDFFGDGGEIEGEFTIINSDTGSLFEGALVPAIAIDPTVFFGRVTAPIATRGNVQARIGGNAAGTTYEDLRDNLGILLGLGTGFNGGIALGSGLDGSLGMASMPLTTPLNFYAPQLQNSTNFGQSATDINATEEELKFDCFDNAHPYCMFREFYFDAIWRDLFVRIGRQQIVWGKTDAFRLQDVINPIDFSYHNVFPSLEDRRIPVLALDAIYSIGNVGPLQDVSLEAAWVWDEFIPDQFGQCGEPWAFTAACEARADAGGHSLFNFSLAGVKKHDWSIGNTQPGARVEFRIPEPSISFSLSMFYGFQKTPVARFSNFAHVTNPNAASMLFLQGIADPSFASGINPAGSVAGAIDGLAAVGATNGGPFAYSGNLANAGNVATSTGVWVTGFDPYDRTGPTPTPAGTLEAANQDLQNAWYAVTNVASPANICGGVPDGPFLEGCAGAIALFGLPWTASEARLEYPRIWSLGASGDYQIPGIDTILRVEMAADLDRKFNNTNQLDQVSESEVFKAAIGLDRSTFIPFVNPDRTAFLSFQTFVEHIIDYDGERFGNDGFTANETTVVSTVFTQNYWRNDSIILTNLAAVDWTSQFATIWAPQLTWIYNDHLSFDIGVNLLWGGSASHNIRDLCDDATLGCLGNPDDWQAGNWQMLNGPAVRAAQAPWWGQQSFADRFMRKRDEFWVGVTWQF